MRKGLVRGLIRRGNRFSVRVQVPKDLQEEIGRQEYWITLRTEDRYEATSRALDIIRDKRNEFDLARRRLNGEFRLTNELSQDEITALGREIYSMFLQQADEMEHAGQEMTADEWEAYVRPHEEMLQEIEKEFAREGGMHPFATSFADQVLDLNLIRLRKDSRSYRHLCRLSMSAALEVQRRIVARLHGHEFPERPDPRFVNHAGESHPFVPVRDQNKPVSKRANRYLKEIGVHGPKHKFHSFRHSFRDEMRRAELDPGIARALGGWTYQNTEAFEIYGRGFSLEHLNKAVRKIRYPGLDLGYLRS